MGIAMENELLVTDEKIQIEWENYTKNMMIKSGWTCDVDDQTKLGFIIHDKEGKRHCRDYDKRTHSFIQLAMDQKITLKSTKETNDL
jgi:hypothetical protein